MGIRCKHDNTSQKAYFFIAFVIAFWEIFLEYSWNIFEDFFKNFFKFKKIIYIILLRFMLKFGKKCHFQKIQIHLQSLLLLKRKCYNAQ
jgi:hypothetical protein